MDITYKEDAQDERVANFLAEFNRYRNNRVESVVVEKITAPSYPGVPLRELTITGQSIDLYNSFDVESFGLFNISMNVEVEENKAVVSWLLKLIDPK